MIGKEALCIQTNPGAVKAGDIYKVLDVIKCECGSVSFDVGVREYSAKVHQTECRLCGYIIAVSPVWYQLSERFVFMDDLDISSVVENVKVEVI